MQPFSHIRIAIETADAMGLDYCLDKLIFGSVLDDAGLLGFELSGVHEDEGFIEHLLREKEKSCAIGVLSHQIADKLTHEDGYGFEKANQLRLQELTDRYQINEKTKILAGHVFIETAIDDLFVRSDGKSKESELLENVIGHWPHELADIICNYYPKYYHINQKKFLGLKRTVRKLNLDFFSEIESNRKITAYIIHRILKKKAEMYKVSTDKLFGKWRYIFNNYPNQFIQGIIYLSQKKAKHITPLFDEAKELVEPDYKMFLEQVKESIRGGVVHYLEKTKTT